MPSPWSGWPAEWWPPAWNGHASSLTDTAWTCLDLNASVLATMPPYLVGAAPSTDDAWLANPDPDLYSSWEEFAKQLFWDYQLGEAFVIATAYYASGYPARFHVVAPWMVNAELGADGLRRYTIGRVDVTDRMLHVRYQSSTQRRSRPRAARGRRGAARRRPRPRPLRRRRRELRRGPDEHPDPPGGTDGRSSPPTYRPSGSPRDSRASASPPSCPAA